MTKYLDFLKSIGLILAYVGLTLLLQCVYLIFKIDNGVVENLAMIVSSLVATVFVGHRLWPNFKGRFTDFKKNFKKYAIVALKNWFVGSVLMILVNFTLITISGYISPNEQANQEMMKMALAYSLIYVCILAPIAEELLFRLNFRGFFKNKKTFMLVSAILFGAFHLIGNVGSFMDVFFFLPYSILGYYFAKAYEETSNIYTSIFAHMFHNTLAMMLSLF